MKNFLTKNPKPDNSYDIIKKKVIESYVKGIEEYPCRLTVIDSKTQKESILTGGGIESIRQSYKKGAEQYIDNQERRAR